MNEDIKAKWYAFQGSWSEQLHELAKEDKSKVCDLTLYAVDYLNTGNEPQIQDLTTRCLFAPFKAEIDKSQKATVAKSKGGKNKPKKEDT